MIFYPCKLSTPPPPVVVNNQVTTEGGYALDARQANPNIAGTIANIINTQLPLIRSIITNESDFNDGKYFVPGCYKVQGKQETPLHEYEWGILLVISGEIGNEYRTVQIYFPHIPKRYVIVTRVHNNGTWTNWKGVEYNILDAELNRKE